MAYITPFHDLKLVLKKYFGLFQNITINVMLKTGTKPNLLLSEFIIFSNLFIKIYINRY